MIYRWFKVLCTTSTFELAFLLIRYRIYSFLDHLPHHILRVSYNLHPTYTTKPHELWFSILYFPSKVQSLRCDTKQSGRNLLMLHPTLWMEASNYSKTSLDVYQAQQCHIPGDSHFYSPCDYHRSHTVLLLFYLPGSHTTMCVISDILCDGLTAFPVTFNMLHNMLLI